MVLAIECGLIMRKKNKYKYIKSNIDLPIINKKTFLNNFWDYASKNTKYIFISHITSGTGMLIPIEEIIK